MKHNEKFIKLFDKKEKTQMLLIFTFFGGLGSAISFVDYLSGLIFLFIGVFALFFLIYKKMKKLFAKVYRITITNEVPRFLQEYWLKKDVEKLEQYYFWSENNKYVPVVFDMDKKITPIHPFNKPAPVVTSGHLKRSLIQKASEVLMKPEKKEVAEALKTGGLMVLAGGGALVIISLFGELTKTPPGV